MSTLWRALIVVLAGLIQGSGAWPMKPMLRFKFENFAVHGTSSQSPGRNWPWPSLWGPISSLVLP